MRVVKVEKEKLEAVSEFCFLGDMLSAGVCCELAAVTPCKCNKGKFCYLPLPFSPTAEIGCIQHGKEFNAACSRDLGHDRGYTEQSVG